MVKVTFDLGDLFKGDFFETPDAERYAWLERSKDIPIFRGYGYTDPIGMIEKIQGTLATGYIKDDIAESLSKTPSEYSFGYSSRINKFHVNNSEERIIEDMLIYSISIFHPSFRDFEL